MLLTEKIHISLSVYSLLVVSFVITQVLPLKILGTEGSRVVLSLLPEKGNLLLKVHNPNQSEKDIYVAYLKFYYALLKMKYHGFIALNLKTTKAFQNVRH